MNRRRDVARSVVALLASAAVFAAAPALAVLTDSTASASLPVSTSSLAPPTGLTAASSCVGTILKSPRVTLSWTASSSAYATGYAIMRLTAGSYVQIGTVSGRTTTTYADNTVALGTTYTYYVAATVHLWTAGSPTASATTPALCL